MDSPGRLHGWPRQNNWVDTRRGADVDYMWLSSAQRAVSVQSMAAMSDQIPSYPSRSGAATYLTGAIACGGLLRRLLHQRKFISQDRPPRFVSAKRIELSHLQLGDAYSHGVRTVVVPA